MHIIIFRTICETQQIDRARAKTGENERELFQAEIEVRFSILFGIHAQKNSLNKMLLELFGLFLFPILLSFFGIYRQHFSIVVLKFRSLWRNARAHTHTPFDAFEWNQIFIFDCFFALLFRIFCSFFAWDLLPDFAVNYVFVYNLNWVNLKAKIKLYANIQWTKKIKWKWKWLFVRRRLWLPANIQRCLFSFSSFLFVCYLIAIFAADVFSSLHLHAIEEEFKFFANIRTNRTPFD